jgi:hypothetical protein
MERGRWRIWFLGAVCLAMLTPVGGLAAARHPAGCRKIVLSGEVNAGQEWKAVFGQGGVFRVVPIQPGKAGYSGWDLVVDREQPAGYPDALLVATPPYDSINEREVGTTFGVRAQDAIGWNPRSFRFLTDPAALQESQRLFQVLGGTKHGPEAPVASSREGMAMQRQLKINQTSSAGQFRILNARLTPGIADAAPFAGNWAIQSARAPHTVVASVGDKATPLGELDWMRFSISLWLPAGWKVPRELDATPEACSE